MLRLPEKIVERVFDLADELIKPSFREIGGIGGDFFKIWRLKLLEKRLTKVKQINRDRGTVIREIKAKALLRWMEFASLEEDELLQVKWENLLANAVDDSNDFNQHFTIVNILKEMNPDDALVLDFISKSKPPLHAHTITKDLKDKCEMGNETVLLTIQNLKRLGLIDHWSPYSTNALLNKVENQFDLTILGKSLIKECNAPD